MTPMRGPLDYHRYPPRNRPPRGRQSGPPSEEPGALTSAAAERGAARLEGGAEFRPEPGPPSRRVRHRVTPPASGARPGTDGASRPHERPADAPEGDAPQEKLRSASPPDRRLKRRRRAPFWKIFRALACLLAVVALCEVAVAALTSPGFNITAVDEQGNELTPAEPLRRVEQKLIGQNWLRADVATATAELEALPSVQHASVVRKLTWPPRLAVVLHERQPFARVGAGHEWWVVDRDGVPFRRAGPKDTLLYAVTGPSLKPVAGHPLPPREWTAAVSFSSTLVDETQQGTPWAVRRLYIDQQGAASLRLEGPAHDQLLVRLGEGRWPEKLKRAREALTFLSATGKRASVLNLVSYDWPTWTPRAAAGAGVKAEAAPDNRAVALTPQGEAAKPSRGAAGNGPLASPTTAPQPSAQQTPSDAGTDWSEPL